MIGAGEAIQAAAAAALAAVEGIGRVYDAPPLQAAVPHAVAAIDGEADWGHKNGAGREVRLAAMIHDKGERPLRLRRLAAEAEAALGGIAPELDSWRLVTMQFVRTRIVSGPRGDWAAIIEYRARMLQAG
jgi:hypothetical protein